MDFGPKVSVDTPVLDGLAYQGAVVAGGDDNSKTSWAGALCQDERWEGIRTPYRDNCEWIGGDTKAWQATCQGGGGLGWEGDWCRGMEKGGNDVLVVTISYWYQVIQLTFLCRLTMPALSYTSPVSPLYRGKPVLTFFFYLQTPSSKTYVEQILLDFYHFQKLCQSCSLSLFWPPVPKLRFHLQERFALGGIVKDATKTPKVRMGALIERRNSNNDL